MENVDQLTKISLAWELYKNDIPKSHIANRLRIHRETAHSWVCGTENHPQGLLRFAENYKKAKKGKRIKRKIDGLLKIRVWKIREENKQCCGQKIKHQNQRKQKTSF